MIALYLALLVAQPIPFSHKVHAGDMKLACKTCHPNPDPGESETIVGPAKCMQCHSAIKTESPAIQRLAAAAKKGTNIPWVRVYAIPSFVFFSHRKHTDKGVTCQDCHGPVAERDELAREKEVSMAACMQCHTEKKTSVECTLCHELQ